MAKIDNPPFWTKVFICFSFCLFSLQSRVQIYALFSFCLISLRFCMMMVIDSKSIRTMNLLIVRFCHRFRFRNWIRSTRGACWTNCLGRSCKRWWRNWFQWYAFNFFVIENNWKNWFSFLHFFYAEMVFDENAPQIDSIESVEDDAIMIQHSNVPVRFFTSTTCVNTLLPLLCPKNCLNVHNPHIQPC